MSTKLLGISKLSELFPLIKIGMLLHTNFNPFCSRFLEIISCIFWLRSPYSSRSERRMGSNWNPLRWHEHNETNLFIKSQSSFPKPDQEEAIDCIGLTIFLIQMNTRTRNLSFSFLRGCSQTTITRFLLFLTAYPLCWNFLWYDCWQKVDIFGPPNYLIL